MPRPPVPILPPYGEDQHSFWGLHQGPQYQLFIEVENKVEMLNTHLDCILFRLFGPTEPNAAKPLSLSLGYLVLSATFPLDLHPSS